MHLHGKIGAKKDPKPSGCGQGHVKKLEEGALVYFASFIRDLNTAVNIVICGQWGAATSPSGADAIQALCDASDGIAMLEMAIDRQSGLSNMKKRDLKEKADKLKSGIDKAKTPLELGGTATARQAKDLIDAGGSKIKEKITRFFMKLISAGEI